MKIRSFALSLSLGLAICTGAFTNNAFAQTETLTVRELVRDTNMIRVGGLSPDGLDSWREYRNCLPPPRGGCDTLVVFAKVFVQPVASANLSNKLVALNYQFVGLENPQEKQTTAEFFSTVRDTNGVIWEEWHAPIVILGSQPYTSVMKVRGFYADGTGGEYFDDNEGNSHVIFTHASGGIGVERKSLGFAGSSVKGTLRLSVADLGYNKDIRLIYTTDNWNTTQEMRIGSGANENEIFYAGKAQKGWEYWDVRVNLENVTSNRMEFAMVYRYGTSGHIYEWWANNGGDNYSVSR